MGVNGNSRMVRGRKEDDPISIVISKGNGREKENKSEMGNVWFLCWAELHSLKEQKKNAYTSCSYCILNG